MFPVFKAQMRKGMRKPLTLIILIAASIVAVLIFGGSTHEGETTVAIFSSEKNAQEIEKKWEKLLNDAESSVNFVITDEEKAREDVTEGRRDVAILVMEDDYRLVTSSFMPQVYLIEQIVHEVFTKEAQLRAVADGQHMDEWGNEINDYMENPPLQVQIVSLEGDELPSHDMGTQLLFGFTLLAALFLTGFTINGIMVDKVSGVWDRMILSSISKTSMYTGHLLYSFAIGMFHISVVFLIFNYLFGYEFGHLGMLLTIAAVYTLSTVSLAVLFTGFLRTPEQFNMIFSSIIPMIPVISNVYMPPGTISNPVLLFIADLFPMSRSVEAMMEVALYDATWSDIALPIALILIIGVLYMGIGINMIERRKA